MSDTTSPAQGPSRTRIVAIAVILALILIAGVYALMDRSVPSSARGIVSAHVVQIAPRVSGTVTEVNVSDDVIVEAGDPLFSLDPRPLKLAVAQAEANLASALQNVDASSALIVAAQVAVTQARTAVAEAEAALDGAEADLRSAQARLEQAQYDLASTTVRARHLGAVTDLTMSDGQFIGTGSPALTFVDAEAG